jgi:hypothetical protein
VRRSRLTMRPRSLIASGVLVLAVLVCQGCSHGSHSRETATPYGSDNVQQTFAGAGYSMVDLAGNSDTQRMTNVEGLFFVRSPGETGSFVLTVFRTQDDAVAYTEGHASSRGRYFRNGNVLAQQSIKGNVDAAKMRETLHALEP